MEMKVENAEIIRIDGYSTFIVGFDDSTVESFAKAFNAAFASKTPANIYSMIAFVGNATEDTDVAINGGYLTEADRISEIISLISQYADFDDENAAEKTLDTTANPVIIGKRKANKLSTQRSDAMNIKKTLQTVVVWYDQATGKVSLAKDLKTGKFVSLSVAQGLLNVELKAFCLPSVSTVKVNYNFAQTLVIVFFTLLVMLLLGVFGLLVAYALPIQAMITFVGVGMFGMMLHAASEDHLKVSV